MRILADENILDQVVIRLRAAGHDVRWAMETDRGEADPNLLELATRERRALITYDNGQIKLNVKKTGSQFYLTIPGSHDESIVNLKDQFENI